MAKLGAAVLTGAWGKRHEFGTHPLSEELEPLATVYAITRRYERSDGGHSHTILYVGQTGDLSEWPEAYREMRCLSEHDANCICIHPEDDETTRLRYREAARPRLRRGTSFTPAFAAVAYVG